MIAHGLMITGEFESTIAIAIAHGPSQKLPFRCRWSIGLAECSKDWPPWRVSPGSADEVGVCQLVLTTRLQRSAITGRQP